MNTFCLPLSETHHLVPERDESGKLRIVCRKRVPVSKQTDDEQADRADETVFAFACHDIANANRD